MKYVVHHRGQQKGPLEIDEVLKCIEKKEVEWTDYVYDENKKDWILLLDHPTFHDYFRRWKQPTQKSQAPRPNEGAEWYVLRDDNKYGPFSFVEMVKMLQEKKLFEFDYAWNRTKMNSWYRISEIDDFQPEKIKALKDQDPGNMTDVFYRRRHARARYGASILLHNNKEVWRGMSLEVSAGGAGLVIESDEIQVGQSLFLHFKAGDGVPPFNAVCTIVSKTPIKGLEHRYGIKFTSISQTIQQAIKKYTDNAA